MHIHNPATCYYGYTLSEEYDVLNKKIKKFDDKMKACVYLTEWKSKIIPSAMKYDLPKSTLHYFIQNNLKDISEELYIKVRKQIDWNYQHLFILKSI